MFSAPFDYYRASSVEEAGRLLKQHPGAKVLAGGHSLVPLLKLRLTQPSALVDIGRIAELKGITVSGSTIRIGALSTHTELCASSELKSACPILCEAASMIGDEQVRNCGTIGGNIAHADPASDLPTVLVALDARLDIIGPAGARTTSIGDFLQGMMTTTLADEEIVTAIEVRDMSKQSMAYIKYSHPASHYAVMGVAAIVSLDNGTCTSASVAIGGLIPVAKRCTSVEKAIVGQHVSADLVSRAAASVTAELGDDVLGDIFASAEYRKAMAPVYITRAIRRAMERAEGAV